MQWNRKCQSLETTPVRQAPGTARTTLELEVGDGAGDTREDVRGLVGTVRGLAVWRGWAEKTGGARKGRRCRLGVPAGKVTCGVDRAHKQARVCVKMCQGCCVAQTTGWEDPGQAEVQVGQWRWESALGCAQPRGNLVNSSDVPLRSRVDIWALQPGSKCEEGRPGMEGERTENSYVSEVLYRDMGPGGQPENCSGHVCHLSQMQPSTKTCSLGEDTGKPGQHHPENWGW